MNNLFIDKKDLNILKNILKEFCPNSEAAAVGCVYTHQIKIK